MFAFILYDKTHQKFRIVEDAMVYAKHLNYIDFSDGNFISGINGDIISIQKFYVYLITSDMMTNCTNLGLRASDDVFERTICELLQYLLSFLLLFLLGFRLKLYKLISCFNIHFFMDVTKVKAKNWQQKRSSSSQAFPIICGRRISCELFSSTFHVVHL